MMDTIKAFNLFSRLRFIGRVCFGCFLLLFGIGLVAQSNVHREVVGAKVRQPP